MKTDIFSYLDYKKYLKDWMQSQPKQGHGLKKAIAAELRCQTAFVSQIFKGHAHLSLEQAERLNSFFGHSNEEGNFFLLLVLHTRAGTESLRANLHKQIQAAVNSRQILKNRFQEQLQLSAEDLNTYFGTWHYAAIHALISIPRYQNKTEIAAALAIPPQKTADILDFLVTRQLADKNGDRYSTGPGRIHLGNDSSLITKHHANWRVQALQSLDRETAEDLHYSSVVSLSQEDRKKLRAMCVDFIEKARGVIAKSPEEELCSFCIDFFQATHSEK